MNLGFGEFSDFDLGFRFMGMLFPVFFVLVFGFVIAVFVRAIAQWNKNNHSPRLTVPARVVSRRTSVSRRHNGVNAANVASFHASTSYYATFEFDSGDRLELHLSGSEYGMLAEGDVGLLTFQGTRFLSFERR